MADPIRDTSQPHRLRDALVRPVCPAACWTSLVFWWASVHPTLLPRSWVAQGIISGVSMAIGVGVGTLGAAAVRKGCGVFDRDVPVLLPRGRQVFAAVAGLVVLAGLAAWFAWQNDQRALVGMDEIRIVTLPGVALVAAVVAVIFVCIGRLIAHPVGWFDRILARHMARPLAHLATAVVVAVLSVVVTRDVVVSRVVESVNTSFGALDEDTAEGVEPTTSLLRSGGPESLVTWESLGFQGRSFIAGGPSEEEMQAFGGPVATVTEPIRVYVGLDTADDVEAQAHLAVEELERTGAFDRSVLVVATVTGTGWINPAAADAIEYMWGGDTAIVGMQYSFLPSWISFLVDLDKAAESGSALIEAVARRWAQLPPDDRPRLIALGESLGSFGSESAFAGETASASVAAVASTVDGALWVGPTFANPVWGQIVAQRDAGSPSWHPSYGAEVAVMGAPDDPPRDGQGPPPTIAYLTHPSDPVTWATADALWSRPQWMEAPTGYDIPDDLLWFPAVTLVQNVFDLMAGFSAPPGYGHDYLPSIANGWATVAAPPGWTTDDTQRLQSLLQAD